MTTAQDRRIGTARRGPPLVFSWNGQPVPAFAGETIAAALLAHGVTALRRTARGDMRGVFCGMGICFECRVTVNGRGTVRACVTPVEAGMDVASQEEAGPLPLTLQTTGHGG